MSSRVVALVEHPAAEGDVARVEVETRRRMTAGEGSTRRDGGARRTPADQLALLGADGATDAAGEVDSDAEMAEDADQG